MEDGMDNTLYVRFDREGALQRIDSHGWSQGDWSNCLHGTLRHCSPQKGDAFLIQHVWERRGRGVAWNDEAGRLQHEIVHAIKEEPDITDQELGETFGPNWVHVVWVVRHAAALTEPQVNCLGAARGAARGAAWGAAGAVSVRDLISDEHYRLLVGPFESVVGEIGD